MSRLYTYLPKDNTALTDGLLSTALSPKGFEKHNGLPEKKAYIHGFMDKLAEFCLTKTAGMAGMTKFKDIRRWVNIARKLRRRETDPVILRKQMQEFVGKNVFPELTIFRSKDPIKPGLPRMPPEVGEIPASAKGFPRRVLYRGEALPDYSTGGATSSGYVTNTGVNIRHITPFADTAAHYGGGPILIYNAKRVPGVGNGRLRFVTDRGLAYITDNFKHPEKMFGQKDLQLGRERLKALDTRRNASWYARDVGLDYEAGIDVSKTLPSRVINAPVFGDAQDVTNLYEFARRQKQLLPENFSLMTLIAGNKEGNLNPKHFNIAERDAILRPLTRKQRLAAERYQAIYDILRGLRDYSWHH